MLKWYSNLTGPQRSAIITVAGIALAYAADYVGTLNLGSGPAITGLLTYLAARLNDAAQHAASDVK